MNAGKACAFIREAVRLVFRGREMEKSVIFDVDGTLWDSSEAVTESWNEVLSRYPGCRKAPLMREDMYRYMGHTMEEIGRMMLPGLLQGERCRIMEECMQHENAYLALHSGSFYPGEGEILGVPSGGRDPALYRLKLPEGIYRDTASLRRAFSGRGG